MASSTMFWRYSSWVGVVWIRRGVAPHALPLPGRLRWPRIPVPRDHSSARLLQSALSNSYLPSSGKSRVPVLVSKRRQISSMYGFYEETQKKYGSTAVWRLFNDAFDYLPLAATVNRIPINMQAVCFVSTEASRLIYIRSSTSKISTASPKFLLQGPWEIWCGQTHRKYKIGPWDPEAWGGFSAGVLPLNFCSITGWKQWFDRIN